MAGANQRGAPVFFLPLGESIRIYANISEQFFVQLPFLDLSCPYTLGRTRTVLSRNLGMAKNGELG
jgi:hypothetical protein